MRVTSTGGTLVLFPGALGDFVCFLPALAAIADEAPAPVVVACRRELEPLVHLCGRAEWMSIDGREASWLFSPEPPREAAEFYGEFARVESFTGARDPDVARNLGRWVGLRGRVHAFRPERPVHVSLHWLRAVGVSCAEPPEFRLDLGLAERSALEPMLLVVHPGSGGSHKRWSRSGFAAAAREWTEKGGTSTVLLGPAESDEKHWWQSQSVSVVDTPPIIDLVRILSGAGLYLGNDSGVTHLAAVSGSPGIALFGPTDARLWKPLSSRLRALPIEPWTPLDESPSAHDLDVVLRELAAAAST
ncbi:MAG: heptosyltransferase [Candidatus Binatota bacterium]|nr:heptosyltransferase [Candidatus Binatota bacterium]